MKLSVILLSLFIADVYGAFLGQYQRRLGVKSPSKSIDLPQEKWFTQRLDHFNDAETRKWQQRYFVNDTFYAVGGPAFINIGGEGPADPIWCVEGQWINWAKDFCAIGFQLEHRYYGESHPTTDLSVKNLQFLSSEQALADLASFRSAMAKKYDLENATWIVFGGSYSGALSAWARLKYPHLFGGAVASSAPLLAQINFKEYMGVVEASLNNISHTCNPAIKKGVQQIDTLVSQGRAGWDEITQKFNLCSTLDGTNAADVSNLYESLSGNFAGVVQYNRDNRDFEGAKATNITIDTVCGIMDNETVGSEIDRYAAVNNLILEAYNKSCLDYSYNDMISDLRNTSWNSSSAEGSRQWTYQTCTEFGYFQSSDLAGQPFGGKFPVQFFTDQCADIYGPKFNAKLLQDGVEQTNIIYGAKDIKVTRVIFPNGSIDPWHYLGITNDLNNEAKALFIHGTAHCADSYPSSPDDPPQLVAAREIIRQHLSIWITTSSSNITLLL